MKKNFLRFVVLAILVFSTLEPVYAQLRKTAIKPGKFERLMKKDNAVVIDVRTAAEFDTGHIPGAVNIDVKGENFLEQIKLLDSTKSNLLYCRTGKRSETALTIMRKNGFAHTRHLKGGIEAWRGPKE